VHDNGLGFDPVYASQIFGMFKRLHGKEIAGTGIGLAICKKIIESHGGAIWAKSSPGVGSTFSFELPDRRVV
jgi:light-regulated signal transduction histidine kinase (bacteriophytochrome)